MTRFASFRAIVVALAVITFCIPVVCHAQPAAVQPTAGESDDSQLAKKLSNPISGLVSVPFQFNWEQNVGPDKPDRV